MNVYFVKVYFVKVHFVKVYFVKVYFVNVYFAPLDRARGRVRLDSSRSPAPPRAPAPSRCR